MCSWFSLSLGCDEVKSLLPACAETGIGELETAAVAVAFDVWREHLSSVEVVAYIDNEGARFSLVKGVSRSWSITRICHAFATVCEQHLILPWCARVPSCSNIADARAGKTDSHVARGATAWCGNRACCVFPYVTECFHSYLTFVTLEWGW